MTNRTVLHGSSRTCCSVIATAIVLGTPAGALANDVLPGNDLLRTDPSNTQFNFALAPIPADFFDPGSDPFSEIGLLASDGLLSTCAAAPAPGSWAKALRILAAVLLSVEVVITGRAVRGAGRAE